ncbi:MAG TPA: hypothetical protein VMR99_03455 [Candidatus Paceibacterota bacterium]|nr:hypothetical protein [Candidatus Paceibacterota bacterium]
MSKDSYKWISIVLAVVVIGLLVYIFTRPKPINTLVLQQDLTSFNAALATWNAQYGANPTPAEQQQLSAILTTYQQKVQEDE